MACESCGDKPKKCNKDFTKAVIEIDNPEQITLMRRVVIPASMGDDTTVPPTIGKYHNVLLYYEANSKSYLYSSDGVPTQLVNGFTNYEEAINLPQINGVTLLGDKSAADLELADAPMVITVADGNTSWSGADTAEDVYDFFLNKGKVNIIFNGEENYVYEIASAGYIENEGKLLCVVVAASTQTTGGVTDFDGNALFGTMTLYTAGKAVDVSQIELQPKLYIADFTGLDLSYNELSGLPATTYSIGMVKPGDGLEVASDGTLSISDIEQYAHFFDTVADMKAATNLVDGDYARTAGFHRVNDGGGALYKISDTGTANEMDIIAIGSVLYANIIPDEVMTTAQFGAIGDGVEDDTDCLQEALNYCKTNNVHQLNFIGTELYTTQYLDLLNYKNITLNFYTRIHRASSASTTFGFRLTECSNIIFNNLDLYSDRDQTELPPQDHTRVSSLGSNIIGVMIYYSSNIIFNNSRFNNTSTDFTNQRYNGTDNRSSGISIDGWYSRNSSSCLFMQYINNVHIRNADIIPAENMGDGDHFIYMSNCVDTVTVRDSKFLNTDTNFGTAIQFYNTGNDTPGNSPRNLLIDDCKFKICSNLITIRLLTEAAIVNSDIEFIDSFAHGALVVKNDAKLNISNCNFHGKLQDEFYETSEASDCQITLSNNNIDIELTGTPTLFAFSQTTTANLNLINNKINWNGAIIYTNTSVTPNIYILNNVILQNNSSTALLSARKNAGRMNFNNNIVVNSGSQPRLIYNGGITSDHCYVYGNQIQGFTDLANTTEIATIHNAYNSFIS